MKPSMFLKIDGIKGESKDADHKEWIDVLSWSWGMAQSGTAHSGGGAGARQASVMDFSFSKFADKSTPALMHSCVSGKHIASAEFHCTKATGSDKGGALPYMKFKFTDLIISNVGTGGSGEETRLVEQASLNFVKVEFQYTEQTAAGGTGAQPRMDWNVEEGSGSVS